MNMEEARVFFEQNLRVIATLVGEIAAGQASADALHPRVFVDDQYDDEVGIGIECPGLAAGPGFNAGLYACFKSGSPAFRVEWRDGEYELLFEADLEGTTIEHALQKFQEIIRDASLRQELIRQHSARSREDTPRRHHGRGRRRFARPR